MPSPSLSQPLRRLWALEKFGASLRVFLALAGGMGLAAYLGQPGLAIPLTLGVIASALAETDDNWRGRLAALLVTLLCFSIAAAAVQLLFPTPLPFAVGLALSTFALVMLGALGERYATIAQATLILALYSMISADQRDAAQLTDWRDPLLLLAGATGYGLLSVAWSALFVNQPLQHSLARSYRQLGRYCRLKAALFEPVRELDREALRLELARQNGQLVAALDDTKQRLLQRLGESPGAGSQARYLKLYFLAQDIHERVSSAHQPYPALVEAFFHSDLLFRCQRLLQLQADACRELARAIELRQPLRHAEASGQALADLEASLARLDEQAQPAQREWLPAVHALADNLSSLQRQLAGASNPDALASEPDSSLHDQQPHSLGEALASIRLQLTPGSRLFRHALRMSLALVVGYALMQAIHAEQGYWILLTTVFVCQPSYGATRTKLVQRIGGTLLGLLAGWALFDLFPAPALQALLAVVAGVLFFATRSSHYLLATAAITLLVLFCFNQIGDGYLLFWPRLLDTLLGALIAAAAVLLILPDWQRRSLHRVAAGTLERSAAYLRQILAQYRDGKHDDLAYRLARRDAHNAEAALSGLLANMLLEPGPWRREADAGLRFLGLSHALLGYLSALGAHRQRLPAGAATDHLQDAAQQLAAHLDELAARLRDRQPPVPQDAAEQALANRLEQPAEGADQAQRLVQAQLALIAGQLAALRGAAAQLLAERRTGSRQAE